jgi:hypothetical protein
MYLRFLELSEQGICIIMQVLGVMAQSLVLEGESRFLLDGLGALADRVQLSLKTLIGENFKMQEEKYKYNSKKPSQTFTAADSRASNRQISSSREPSMLR